MVNKLISNEMEKQKEPKAPKAPTAKKPAEKKVPADVATVTEVVEDVLQNIENALSGIDKAVVMLAQEHGSTERLVRSRRHLMEVVRDIKPYIE